MSTTPHDRYERLAALRPVRKRAPIEPARETGQEPCALSRLLGGITQRNTYGEHIAVRQWHESPEECALDADVPRFLLPAGADPSPAVRKQIADPAQWLFLDTETTGLAGGTGTYAFLVGLAWWDAGGLQIEQLFMRDHGEEHSLLLELSRRMAERCVLVTFNGKSFDWPLLETRFRMTRSIAPETPAAHLDLLHPARQLWRLRLGSVRLTELERRVLAPDGIAWTRRNDIDSALIPQIYFDYLRGGSAEPLAGVFRHNEMDLRGLAALAGKILGVLARPESLAGIGDAALDLYGASRLFHRRGDAIRSRSLCERALTAGLPPPVERTARRDLALAARRERDFSRAAMLWEELIRPSHSAAAGAQHVEVLQNSGLDLESKMDGIPRLVLEAYEQLAIHYEHRTREPRRAAEFAREAMSAVRKASQFGMIPSTERRKLLARWEHRLARLERKLRRGPLETALAVTCQGPSESNRE